MHASIYMLEKELIEHKNITRVPFFLFIVAVIMIVGLIANSSHNSHMAFEMHYSGNNVDMFDVFSSNVYAAMSYSVSLVSIILSSLYLPKTLRKERVEGSSMFWRSMPVSHALTHSVKLGFGLLVIPAICSLLLLSTNLILWLANISINEPVTLFLGQVSFIDIIINWLDFLFKMSLIALALLPLATIALMTSQLVSSPILIMLLGYYVVKWVSLYLFGFTALSVFFDAILSIPNLIFSSEPLTGFIHAGVFNLIIYYTLGIVALFASLSLSQTNELSFRQ
ncbi:hypothetical protein R3X26_05515 [Vibrio sp. TH_r3]|uniref:hypothetical protein n=1 Tax=Vibrio sp. TH_r3 TaxID=3082084 RepID=UPI0029550E37|nr:hypothetical protein [Vibrio sp. TH_r3]MDV7103866.1 hypothetical protein [Vibrio sp. TH_r3]